MKNLWALPPLLRLALARQALFSVQNDLLAFPQYEIIYPDTYISSAEAEARLAFAKSPSPEKGDEYVAAAASIVGEEPDLSYDVATQQWKLEGVKYPTNSEESYERMLLRGRPYLCTIPHIPPPSTDNSTISTSPEEQRQELIRASENGWELLKGLEGHCLFYPHFTRSWWVYSFCYNEVIRQFHPLEPGRGVPIYPPTEDPNVQSYSLAEFRTQKKEKVKGNGEGSIQNELHNADVDIPSTELQTRGETNYLVQRLGGGTICDLTGFERRVEVQFHCNPTSVDKIHMIKETASCVYLIVIHTPRLCSDVAFLPPEADKPYPITCQEIVSPEDLSKWKARQAAKAHQFFSEQVADKSSQSRRMKIGDIEVGAQKLVGGPPERTIIGSNIVGGEQQKKSQEKTIAVLAKSDGKYITSISEKEMKRLGVKTNKQELDSWINDLPQGLQWKLIAVETAEGVEYRAIFDIDKGEDDLDLDNNDGTAKNEASNKDRSGKDEKGSEEEYK